MFSEAGNSSGGPVLLVPHQPVSRIQNKVILEVDEISGDEDGGSELSDIEDVFVGDEAELPKKVYYDARPKKRKWSYTT